MPKIEKEVLDMNSKKLSVLAAAAMLALLLGFAGDLFPYGEAENGFPGWQERFLHMMTNRARCDPAADLADCTGCADRDCFDPVPPMAYSYELNRAARLHCTLLDQCTCGMGYDSPCTLVSDIADLYLPGTCNGSPDCACDGGSCSACSGTSWSDRDAAFGAGHVTGNLGMNVDPDPMVMFYLWLHAGTTSSECTSSIETGTRWNILGESYGRMGAGYEGSYYFQDIGGGAPDHVITAGAHYPDDTASDVAFRANWYDEAGGPDRAMVNIDGLCQAMDLERGTAVNGTYLYEGAVTGDCPRYYFIFYDGAGAKLTYPDTGSFGIGGGTCANWEETRAEEGEGCDCVIDCEGRMCGPNGCGGSCGECDFGLECDEDGQCVPVSADPEPEDAAEVTPDAAPDGAVDPEPDPTDTSVDTVSDPGTDPADDGDGGGDGGCGCKLVS
jgi:hypothetical protein